MNLFGLIWLRKAAAALFFAALAFVYAEKVIHKHECNAIETIQTSLSQNFDYSTCTLCDFQPVSASEVPVISECLLPVKFIFSTYYPVKENYYYCTVSSIAGRGPPAD